MAKEQNKLPTTDADAGGRLRSRVKTVLDVDQTIVKLDTTVDRMNATLDTFGVLLVDFTRALEEFNASVQTFNGTVDGFDGVVEKADGILSRAETLLAPLAATQYVGDQLRAAGQAAGGAVKKGLSAGKGLTQRG